MKLDHGKNELEIKSDDCQIKIVVYRLSHEPNILTSNLPKTVRVFYVICKDDTTNGDFQSGNPNENKLNNARKRIDVGIKLLQTFLSEIIYRRFGHRKTFMLSNDVTKVDDENVCETFYSNLTTQRALEMTSNELFIHLAEEFKENCYDVNVKYIAILSFTRYNAGNLHKGKDIFENTKGYCALGK